MASSRLKSIIYATMGSVALCAGVSMANAPYSQGAVWKTLTPMIDKLPEPTRTIERTNTEKLISEESSSLNALARCKLVHTQKTELLKKSPDPDAKKILDAGKFDKPNCIQNVYFNWGGLSAIAGFLFSLYHLGSLALSFVKSKGKQTGRGDLLSEALESPISLDTLRAAANYLSEAYKAGRRDSVTIAQLLQLQQTGSKSEDGKASDADLN